jgi:sialate O-acetylesterase
VGFILFLISFLVSVFVASNASLADIRLPSVIGSNMVLQRNIPVPIWGWADPGEKVKVILGSQVLTTKADKSGAWKVKLSPLSAGGPFELTIQGKNTVKLTNVMAGEVWVCSGQSNMEMRVCHVNDAPNEVAGALNRNIRLFQVTNDLSPDPQRDCEARWEECRPSTVYLFSAAAYFFGREIQRELNVPVGLIHSSWGGTTAETWMRIEGLQAYPELKSILDEWAPVLKSKSTELLAYHRKTREWEEDVHHVLYAGKPILPQYVEPPKLPVEVTFAPSVPSWVYNGMIAPVVPFGIKGVIWYQGESNAGKAYQYRTLFPALIKDWRNAWGEGDFPFLFVQLANFGQRRDNPGESAWAELREAQFMTLSVPNTAMAVAADIGDGNNVHPKNKQEVGKRLALGALHAAYGKNCVFSGPTYHSMIIQNGRARLKFTSIGGGLTAKGDGILRGFALAGQDHKFVRANALIEGNEVVVWSDEIKEPAAVRYAWEDNPECSLYNREGLPASPFRTDDWPGITRGE